MKKYEAECLARFHELREREERPLGYSPAAFFTVRVVVGCDNDTAAKLLDEYQCEIDWSEISWAELRRFFKMEGVL